MHRRASGFPLAASTIGWAPVKTNILLASVLGLTLCCAVPAVTADTLPPAVVYAYITNGPTTNNFGGISSSLCYPSPYGCESTTLITSYSNGVLSESYSGTATGDSPPNSEGFASADFYFEVLGPPGKTVQLVFTATLSSSSSGAGGGEALALYSIGDFTSPEFSSCSESPSSNACANAGYSTTSPLLVVSDFTATTGTQGYVFEGLGGGHGYNAGTVNISVDPTISFAPGFDAAGYSLVFSPNAISVPEPAVWSMMIAGLALAGAGARARRSREPSPT
ncbi:MAG TPA: PEP-CTERM sorting domain-containing protein [Caulobacteraceae bacterium]